MQNRAVLVVDDDDDLRFLMVEMLTAEGYDASVRATGPARSTVSRSILRLRSSSST